ncbi:MAG TPA: gamma-glutamyl-gamma-aminobutyrate hydrolase family protein [Solirubrobacteraceae bacterium]|jgi:putative glutamine amidotransferase|nr:gamma-glutamyl-gamma-aminobutyrate hydrolase family protein [Solirubrobacteraceae bacterium]
MPRPVIGICSALERSQWGVWDQVAALVPLSYIEAVQRAGGVAVILPPDAHVSADPEQLLDLLDGLMLAGGADIDPSSYGERPHPQTVDTVPARDEFEIALTRAAIERDLPVLGICRGMQLINVACGGTLLQHLPEHVGHEDHRRVLGSFEGADHDVELQGGTLAALAAGETDHATKSHHHQGVDRVGDGLLVSGHSTLDNLPEAIELDGRRFVLGVQWHPEVDPGSAVIASFVSAARREQPAADAAAAGAGSGA